MTALALGQDGYKATGPGSKPSRARCIYVFTDICQKFHSNGSQGIGQLGSEAVGTISSLCRVIGFNLILLKLWEVPMVLLTLRVGLQVSGAVGTGSIPSPYLPVSN